MAQFANPITRLPDYPITRLPDPPVLLFSLTGFSTLKREGIELTGSFTAAVNAELTVGTLQPTITVAGETPIVDVQSVRRQATISGEVIAAIPTARAYGALFSLIPAVTTAAGAALDVQIMPGLTVFGGAGGRDTEGRLQLDGLNVGAALSGGGVSSYNVLNASPVLTYNSSYSPGGPWLIPNSVLSSRFAKISATVDF